MRSAHLCENTFCMSLSVKAPHRVRVSVGEEDDDTSAYVSIRHTAYVSIRPSAVHLLRMPVGEEDYLLLLPIIDGDAVHIVAADRCYELRRR